ncbi:hypothetical protein HW555_002294, partial [Spodoptera exigua]
AWIGTSESTCISTQDARCHKCTCCKKDTAWHTLVECATWDDLHTTSCANFRYRREGGYGETEITNLLPTLSRRTGYRSSRSGTVARIESTPVSKRGTRQIHFSLTVHLEVVSIVTNQHV